MKTTTGTLREPVLCSTTTGTLRKPVLCSTTTGTLREPALCSIRKLIQSQNPERLNKFFMQVGRHEECPGILRSQGNYEKNYLFCNENITRNFFVLIIIASEYEHNMNKN